MDEGIIGVRKRVSVSISQSLGGTNNEKEKYAFEGSIKNVYVLAGDHEPLDV